MWLYERNKTITIVMFEHIVVKKKKTQRILETREKQNERRKKQIKILVRVIIENKFLSRRCTWDDNLLLLLLLCSDVMITITIIIFCGGTTMASLTCDWHRQRRKLADRKNERRNVIIVIASVTVANLLLAQGLSPVAQKVKTLGGGVGWYDMSCAWKKSYRSNLLRNVNYGYDFRAVKPNIEKFFPWPKNENPIFEKKYRTQFIGKTVQKLHF